MVAARTVAIAAATAVAADARPRVTVVVRVTAVAAIRLRAMAAVAIRRRAVVAEVAIQLRAVDPRTVADRRQAVAADMDGDTALDSFPA